jgi:hypothetical protein
MKKRVVLIALSVLASSMFVSVAFAAARAWAGLNGGGGG